MQPAFPDGVPPELARAFTCESDRANWESGHCRLRLLSHFSQLESDVRGDRGEGQARHIVLGENNTPVQFGGSFHNPVYIVSFCEADAPSLLNGRYGGFTSRISDVRLFVVALGKTLQKRSTESRQILGVELLRVRYSRDNILDPEPNRAERHRLMVCQKAQADEGDRESL